MILIIRGKYPIRVIGLLKRKATASWKINFKFIMSFLIEFWKFLRVRKKFWLIPIFLILIIFGGLIVLSQGSAVAPFIYTIF